MQSSSEPEPIEADEDEGSAALGQVAQCDATSPGKIFTLGIRYRRSSAVDTTIQNGQGLGPMVSHFIGRGVRSNLMASNLGASYTAVNEKLAEEAPSEIGAGVSQKYIMTYHNPDTDQVFEHLLAGNGTESKSGAVLVQFKLCGISDSVRFFRCNVAKGGVGSLADFIAVHGWNAVSRFPGFDWMLRRILLKELMEKLPGEVLYGLELQVGGGTTLGADGEAYANTHVCAFEGGLFGSDGGPDKERTDRLFRHLSDPDFCPPVTPVPPKAPPRTGACDPPQFTQILEGDTYCADGDNQLSAGTHVTNGIWGCEENCLSDPRCSYFSFWRSGVWKYCRTFMTCRTAEMVQEAGATITTFRRTSLQKFHEMHNTDGQFCAESLSQGVSWGLANCRNRCLQEERCNYFSFWFTGGLNYCRLHATCNSFGYEPHQISIFELVESMSPEARAALASTGDDRAHTPMQAAPNTVISGERAEQPPPPGTAPTDSHFAKVDVTAFFNDAENGAKGRILKDGKIKKCCCKKATTGGFDCLIVDLMTKAKECKNKDACSCHAGKGFNSYRDRRTTNHRCIISRDSAFLVDDNM